MSNTITAFFKGRIGVAEAVYQNDYGIIMNFDSIELPAHFDCYFSVIGEDEAIPGVGADRQVVIPNTCLAKAGNVTLHIPLHTGANDSEVEYVVYFKVIGRARPADDGTPVQMSAIERALALLQAPLTNIEDIVNDALAFTGPTLKALQATDAAIRAEMQQADSVLNARMDSFTHLAEGSTTGDAELIDGRVGADGVTYSNIGTANRTQFTNLKSELNMLFESPTNYSWVSGYINNSGDRWDNQQYSAYCTGFILAVEDFLIIPKSDRQICVAYYDSDTTEFISRTDWLQSQTIINKGSLVRISIATVSVSTLAPLPDKTLEEVLSNILILIDYKKAELDAVATRTVYVESGWWNASAKPSNYYLNVKRLNFKQGDTITAKSGYDIALANANGSTVQVWTTSYTAASELENYAIIIRKTGASEPIDKDISGLTLSSYIEETYTNDFAPAWILTDQQIQYIKSAMPNEAEAKSKWADKKVAFVGDSITYGVNTSQGNIYYQLLNDMIGFSDVYADGVASSCYSSTSNYGTSITPIVNRWANIPTDRDLVVIFAGTNDFGHNTPLGSIEDTTDVSFYGAISMVINGILEANPDVRLVLMTPLHRYNYTSGEYPNDTQPNGQGHTLKDYVDAIKEIAEMYGVPLIDLFSTACLNPRISAIKTNYVTDGLHPNAAGHNLLAQRIKPLLETM